MTIRRIGFHPFVQTTSLIEAQRRIQAVEKHAGTEDTELMTEEQALESLNARYQAELDALEAERAQRERQVEELRSKLVLTDGYEATSREEPVDLKGGVNGQALPGAGLGGDRPAVSLAQLARANVYESVSRAERAAAERAALEQAEAERVAREQAAAASVDGGVEVEGVDDWMAAELSVLQSEMDELEGLDEAEEAYSDPGADAFVASLDDIANLEVGGSELDDPGADAFVASLDDIAHLVPESAPEAMDPGGAEAAASEPSVILAEDVAAPEPRAEQPKAEDSTPPALPFNDEGGPDSH